MTTTRLMLPLAAATLRRRWLGFVGSFTALTLGVGLIAAVGLLLNSTIEDNSAPGAPSLHKLLSYSSFLAAFVSVFVVASTFAFAVAQRRQETALLRAVGATPRQVQLLVLGEALVVATAAAAAGCLLGVLAAPGFASWLVDHDAAQPGFGPHLAAAPLLIAAATGLAVALLGAFTAARRASRVRPAEALGDSMVDRKVMPLSRWLLGVLYLGLVAADFGAFFAARNQQGGDPALRDPQSLPQWSLLFDVLVIIAIAVFAPLLVPPLVRLFTLPVLPLRGATGLLARQNALAAVRRTVSTVTPAFLVIGLTGAVVGGTLAFSQARVAQTRAALQAAYVVQPPRGQGLSEDTVRRLRMLPGANAVTMTPTVLDGLDFDGTPDAARQVTPAPSIPTTATVVDGDLAAAWNLPIEDGSAADLHGRSVAVSAELAKGYGWQVGDLLDASLSDGTTVPVRVVALFRAQLSLAQVLLPKDALAGHLAAERVSAAYLSVTDRASAESVLAGTGARLTAARNWGSADSDPAVRQQWITMIAILGPALLYALIAIVNTMMMSTGDRLRDFAVLRLTGGTRRQVFRMVASETALATLTATALALLVTAATQAGMVALLDQLVLRQQASIAWSLPWAPLAISALVCLGLALVSSLLPVSFALRIRPLDLAAQRQ
ncbi:FtsX-like permease family protein [Streptomyces sp. NPDC093064]|uniref:FtsX-like permease family protein n=1 Tax=Streptomyces sp. NPDC093064 TaxID=3366020 RepID=UPI00381737F8